MLLRRRRRAVDDDPDVIVEHGRSFAKGPNLAIGSILLVYGLTGLLTNAVFPHASSSFPHGDPTGKSWLGPEVNGWTNFFCIAAGGLLIVVSLLPAALLLAILGLAFFLIIRGFHRQF